MLPCGRMQQDDLFFGCDGRQIKKPLSSIYNRVGSAGMDYSSRLLQRRRLIGIMDSVYERCGKHCLHGLCPENCTTKTVLHSVNECVNKNVTSSIATVSERAKIITVVDGFFSERHDL